MTPLPGIVRCLAAVVLLAAARGQDAIKFDPSRDLDGFDQASLSQYSDLYPLRTYLALRDKEIPAADLAQLRERWKSERALVEIEIERIRADPREEYLHEVRKRVHEHPFFGKLALDVDRSVPGCDFFVQRAPVPGPATQGPDYARRIADFYGPVVKGMQAVFEKTYAVPLGLERRPDLLAWAICILDTEDDYHAFGQTTEQMWRISAAYYEPRLKMIVSYGDPYAPTTTPARQRYLILTEFVRALEHAYFSGKGERPAALWLNLGLASYLAWREGVVEDPAAKNSISPDVLADVVKAAQKKEDRGIFLHPLADLLQLRVTAEVPALAVMRAQELSAKEPDGDRALKLFYQQSALWMHFLHEAQGGRYRDPFLKYFQSAMSGLGGLDAFYVAFRGVDLSVLDRDFYRWVFAEHARVYPTIKLDPAVADAIFADRAPKRPPEGARPAPSSAPSLPSSLSPFSPAAAAVEPKEFEGQHALALLQVVRGDLEPALETLENLAANGPPPPEDVRIARDIERVRQVILLRDAWLESLKRSGQPFVGKYRGVDYVAKVDRVEGGWIHLGDNRAGLSKIPLAALEPYEVARQAGKREEQGTAAPWARLVPYILVGDAKWEQLFRELKDDSAGATQLRDDAKSWYPELLRTAQAATALNQIAMLPEPKTQKDSGRLFDAVKALLTGSGDLPIVQRKTDVLKQIVAGVIVRTYVEQDPGSLCHGTFTALGNGLVSLVYDFTKPEEALDFRKDPGYLADLRTNQQQPVKKEEASAWAVANGELSGSGAACYRHYLDFTGPITLRYDVAFRNTPTAPGTKPAFMFMVGVCDDGAGSYAGCFNFGSAMVIDLATKAFHTVPDEKTAFAKRPYKIELKNDGETVSITVNGEKRQSLPASGRKSGAVILWFHTDNVVAIQRMEIEGRVDSKWAEKARALYYEGKLVELGFR